MDDLLIRCSSLSKIIGTPKKKGEVLTQTAKSYIRSIVKQKVYDYQTHIKSKYLEKGTHTEQDCIDLYNEVHFTKHIKNDVRMYNGFIQGECDINAPKEIIDIKSSWSKETFPAIKEEAIDIIKKGGYDWQGVGYMWLYDKPKFTVAFCFVETPDYLAEYEDNWAIHSIEDIEPELRITKVSFERNEELEDKVKEKVKLCRKYAEWYETQIRNKF